MYHTIPGNATPYQFWKESDSDRCWREEKRLSREKPESFNIPPYRQPVFIREGIVFFIFVGVFWGQQSEVRPQYGGQSKAKEKFGLLKKGSAYQPGRRTVRIIELQIVE